MGIDNEIINAIRFYEILKKDIHTLLVKNSKNPLDYGGQLVTVSNGWYVKYPIHEDHKDNEMYHALSTVGILLESMLKSDIQLWDKTQGIEMIKVAPDYRCENIILDVRFHK